MNEIERSQGEGGGIRLEVGLIGHKTIDYDRRALRRALNEGGARVRKAARRLLARQGVSAPGQFPGLESGRLQKSIGIVSRGTKGGWVRVGPRTFKDGHMFYPAVLYYGSAKRHIAKRANYMTAALQSEAPAIRTLVRAALRDCLVPR